jgi:hypothetical protein
MTFHDLNISKISLCVNLKELPDVEGSNELHRMEMSLVAERKKNYGNRKMNYFSSILAIPILNSV